jgi:LacI family repressor for deo operon, udp, cdd, tsx, nupC, and nupG
VQSSGITQREVARRAGVSPRTVSNVVNGFAHVSAETRARVQQVLATTGYRPNLAARNLRHGRTGTIALVLPLNVPYFAELTEFVVDAARKRSYLVMIDKTDGDPAREREFVMGTERSAWFDGMIFSPFGLTESELSTRSGTSSPMVLLGQRLKRGQFDHVRIDNVAAAQRATTHLIQIGRRRIAHIGRHRDRSRGIAYDRMQGYRRALRSAGIPADPSLVLCADGFRRASGARAMAELLDRSDPPDAVFCYNDPLALGAMREAHSRGLRLPDDLAVAGFDDSEDGQFAMPSLTTISQDKAQIAEAAVDLLVRRINGDIGPPATVNAGWTLVVRESTAGTARTDRPQSTARTTRSPRK